MQHHQAADSQLGDLSPALRNALRRRDRRRAQAAGQGAPPEPYDPSEDRAMFLVRCRGSRRPARTSCCAFRAIAGQHGLRRCRARGSMRPATARQEVRCTDTWARPGTVSSQMLLRADSQLADFGKVGWAGEGRTAGPPEAAHSADRRRSGDHRGHDGCGNRWCAPSRHTVHATSTGSSPYSPNNCTSPSCKDPNYWGWPNPSGIPKHFLL